MNILRRGTSQNQSRKYDVYSCDNSIVRGGYGDYRGAAANLWDVTNQETRKLEINGITVFAFGEDGEIKKRQ